MGLSIRFLLPLLLTLGLMAFGVVPLVDQLTLRWFVRDLDIRTQLLTSTVQDTLSLSVAKNSQTEVEKLFNRMIQDERLYALGFCDTQKKLIHKTPTYPKNLGCVDAPELNHSFKKELQHAQGPLHMAFIPIGNEQGAQGHLVLFHDMSFVQRRSDDTKRYIYSFFILLSVVISTITVLIAQWSWKGWINGIRSIIRGEGLLRLFPTMLSPELRPIAKDLRAWARDIERERRSRDEGQMTWNARTLKEILQRELAGDEILIVSNREPYIHTLRQGKIQVQLPASGLVTALEPVMRACSGTWIAHGSGNADKQVVDEFDRVQVPPGHPAYQIRRVWLTKEEEKGYYYGFSNEGLWPLCHMAHTRPSFRGEDWRQYVLVNEKFAQAVVEEAKTDDPVVLVQDYHLALVPRLIKNQLPNATIITFWHIPWPNPEAFGICPWREELLDGLLGSSILGFHTRFHCNNFIDTVDRFMESRIDLETSTISYGGKITAIKHYPISIEWPSPWPAMNLSITDCRQHIRTMNSLPSDIKIGIGVDRLDYTKGIVERFLAVERLLELHPEWVGKFCFIQIAAPSRTVIEQYQSFEAKVRTLAERINQRFSSGGVGPICMRIEHHEPSEIYKYYRGSDLCFVSSLHDGMNLVAKEFISARDDEKGVLILSQFAGASRELPQALIVNPYNTDQCATALKMALEMSESEQKDRMKEMRGLIEEYNVYRWAGRMLMDASRIRKQERFLGKFPDSTNLKAPALL